MSFVRTHQVDVPGIGDIGNNSVIINGQMDVWQRGSTFTSIADEKYCADRFKYRKSGGSTHTISRSTIIPSDPTANRPVYSLNVSLDTTSLTTTGTVRTLIEQEVEGYFSRHLQDHTCTLSFWVRSSLPGTYCVAFVVPFSRSYVVEYVINAANTWEFKQVSVPLSGVNLDLGSEENLTRFIVRWSLLTGTSLQNTPNVWHNGNYSGTASQINFNGTAGGQFYITSIDMRIGDFNKLALPTYSPRTYPEEFRLCQRYFEKTYLDGTTPGTINQTAFTIPVNANSIPAYKRIVSTGTATYGIDPEITLNVSTPSSPTPTSYQKNILVFVNGVQQIEGSDYAFSVDSSSDDITFYGATIPPVSAIIEVYKFGNNCVLQGTFMVQKRTSPTSTMTLYSNATGSNLSSRIVSSSIGRHGFAFVLTANTSTFSDTYIDAIHWAADSELYS